MAVGFCSIEGCYKKTRLRRGWCNNHYERWRKYGDPLGKYFWEEEARFLSHVTKTDDCWIWTAVTNKDGYGQFFFDGKMGLAHRWSYKHFVGAIPTGLLVCHMCDIVGCVNPEHLFTGTDRDNKEDCIQKGRTNRAGTGISNYVGVTINKTHSGRYQHWRAGITINGKYFSLGQFKTEEQAALAYNQYLIDHGIQRPLNVVDT